ncbi:hypothetical protein [Paraburkholderia elongata]|uniref:Uncharacterized protein n=1 Tax=Paraburkholderia elongata TaxID=2675747 RepID=A0A972P1J4_9BURK|nr:hypothetical protein [Paraburkholderia elongata]NPT62454.1 hypothetical protein [Paraburkholderia elongata]
MQRNQIVAAFDFDGTITTQTVCVTSCVTRSVAAGLPSESCVHRRGLSACLLACAIGAPARFLAATLGGMTQLELDGAAQRYATEKLNGLIGVPSISNAAPLLLPVLLINIIMQNA